MPDIKSPTKKKPNRCRYVTNKKVILKKASKQFISPYWRPKICDKIKRMGKILYDKLLRSYLRYRNRVFVMRQLEFLRSNLDESSEDSRFLKFKIRCLTTRTKQLFKKWIVAYYKLRKPVLGWGCSHIDLSISEDYQVHFEYNSRIFYKGNRALIKDIKGLDLALFKMTPLLDVLSWVEILKNQGKVDSLDKDVSGVIKNILTYFESLEIIIPGGNDLPFEFNPDLYLFNLDLYHCYEVSPMRRLSSNLDKYLID